MLLSNHPDVLGSKAAKKSKVGPRHRDRGVRVIGEFLRKKPKQAGARGRKGGGTRSSRKEPQPDAPPTLDKLDISKKDSGQAKFLAGWAAEKPELFEQVKSDEVSPTEAKREPHGIGLSKKTAAPLCNRPPARRLYRVKRRNEYEEQVTECGNHRGKLRE